MPVEKRNPLPVGRYWVDVPKQHEATFDFWLQTNPFVKVVALEASDPRWYKFDVTQAGVVHWDGPGYPSIVVNDAGSFSRDDTSTAAAVVEKIREDAASSQDRFFGTLKTAAVALAVIATVTFGFRFFRR